MKKLKQKQIYVVVLLFVIVAVSLLFITKYRSPTLTGYEDSSGVVYECSKPIKAQEGHAKLLLGHPQGLIPVSANDANKYCHSVGIE
jgi:hypothetical protein